VKLFLSEFITGALPGAPLSIFLPFFYNLKKGRKEKIIIPVNPLPDSILHMK
jgi:hypothetical protein